MRIVLTALLVLPTIALAHHSFFAIFDAGTVSEMEGEITRIQWRNPHVLLTMRATGADGQEELWELETNSVSVLRRTEITSDVVQVGDRVRVAGHPAKRDVNQLFLTNMLLSDGQEVLFSFESPPRWPDQSNRLIGKDSNYWFAEEGETSEPSRGIFRVWSHGTSPMLFPETVDPNFDLNSYPLTDAAREAVASFNPLDSPIANCRPKGMPTIMEQPYPMEIVDLGSEISLHTEEYDLERRIHMNGDTSPAGTPSSPLGYSVGRWEGNTLVVNTSGVNWGYFDTVGIPLSEEVELVERFTPSEDGSKLDYSITVTDPYTFTEPVVLEKYWLYVPGVQVEPYDCIPEG